MWQDKLKEIIYILENANVNEIEVSFWGRKFRVVKEPNIVTKVSIENKNTMILIFMKVKNSVQFQHDLHLF